MRVKRYVIAEHGVENKPVPMFYFKSTSKSIPRVPNVIEGALKWFEITLRTSVSNRKTHNTTNITKFQEDMLKCFQSHPEYAILQTDKKLGPCAIHRENYIEQCMSQCLSNKKYYERIDESTVQEHMNISMNEFLNLMKETNLKLPLEDQKYLNHANNNIAGIYAFYCMPKIHKNKTPTSLRPVTATVNTKLH